MKSSTSVRVLEQFNNELFNALVEKIDILSPELFCFVLKNGMRNVLPGRDFLLDDNDLGSLHVGPCELLHEQRYLWYNNMLRNIGTFVETLQEV
ncbi:MAG TPA: hypothetical protein VGE40_00645 [Bacilli bacterium]